MKREIEGRTYKYTFTGLNDFAEYLEKNRDSVTDYNYRRYLFGKESNRYFNESSEQMYIKLRSGDSNLLGKYQKAEGTVHLQRDEIEAVHDVQGSYVDVSTFLSGEPECMVDFVHQKSERFLDINIGIGMPAGVQQERVLMKCIYVVKLVDLLERTNHGCRINIISRFTGRSRNPKTIEIVVEFKNYEETLNLSHLLYACCNVDFFRRGCLGVHAIAEKAGDIDFMGTCLGGEVIKKGAVNIKSFYGDHWEYKNTDADFHEWTEDVTHDSEAVMEDLAIAFDGQVKSSWEY